jgi:serine/threonine protein phosphatase 1
MSAVIHYAIGDVHGYLDLLDRLLEAVASHMARQPANTRFVIVFLGDYIDRGPDSLGVLHRVRTLSQDPRFRDVEIIPLRGNHEQMLLDVLHGDQPWLWLENGGRKALESFQVRFDGNRYDLITDLRRSLGDDLLNFLHCLPVCHFADPYFFVHAGIRPGIPLDQQSEDEMLWIRGPFLSSQDNHGVMVVHGHTPYREVEIAPNRIGVDTGVYSNGVLSAVSLGGDGNPSILQVRDQAEDLVLKALLRQWER